MSSILEETILKSKPDMKAATVKTYISALMGLYKYANPKEDFDFSWFKNHQLVDKAIEDKTTSNHTKRNYYNALVAIFRDDTHYKDKMNEGNRLLTSVAMKNERSITQNENWLSFEEVQEIVDKKKIIAKRLLSPSSGELSAHDLSTLCDFILLAVSSGRWISPRRTADWTNLKIRGTIDKKNDNYIDKDEFVFNVYKTAGTYGEQRIKIPNELLLMLKKYIKKNPYDYLIFSNKGKAISQVVVAQRLNKIFGKKISTSMLRHIYITNEYEGIDVGKLRTIADNMGHDIETAMNYVVR